MATLVGHGWTTAPEIRGAGARFIAEVRADAPPRPARDELRCACAYCTWEMTGPVVATAQAGRDHRDREHPELVAEARARGAARVAAAKVARAPVGRRGTGGADTGSHRAALASGVLGPDGHVHGGGRNSAQRCRQRNGGRLENACPACREVLERDAAARKVTRNARRAAARAAVT